MSLMYQAAPQTHSIEKRQTTVARNMDLHGEVPEPTTNQRRRKSDQNLPFDETLHLQMFASQLQKPCDHFFNTSPSDGDKFHTDDDTSVLYTITHSALKNREVNIPLIQFLLMTMNHKT
jgi:hypothetical protein